MIAQTLCLLVWVTATLACATSACASTVSTFAGSGLPGTADGPAAAATFLSPSALAYAPDKTLYVVDSAAQRVRAISPAGVVSTLAGSGDVGAHFTVAPGYRDGPAKGARFNWPRGVAVAPDGTVYVADTGNHAVRSIKDGVVMTAYGGSATGRTLELSRPTAIAISKSGSIYIADADRGVRRIDPDGKIVAIGGFRAPLSLSLIGTGAGDYVFGADADGIFERIPWGPPPTDNRFRSLNDPGSTAPTTPDPTRSIIERFLIFAYPLGYPSAVASNADDEWFYADPRTNTIRYLWANWAPMMRIIAGAPNQDASGETAGFADGPGNVAKFNAPLGIAVRAPGTLMVADSGNHRIRQVRYDIDSEIEATAGQRADEAAPGADDDYRIAFVGNSFTAYDATWSDSVPGLVQSQLRKDDAVPAADGRPSLRLTNGLNGFEGLPSIASAAAATSLYGLVLVNFNVLNLGGYAGIKDVATVAKATGFLKQAQATLQKAGIPLVVALHPLPEEISPTESLPSRMAPGGMVPELAVHETLLKVVTDAGVPYIDAYDDFLAAVVTPHGALYGTDNAHFAQAGRAVMARAIVGGLERLNPWQARR